MFQVYILVLFLWLDSPYYLVNFLEQIWALLICCIFIPFLTAPYLYSCFISDLWIWLDHFHTTGSCGHEPMPPYMGFVILKY